MITNIHLEMTWVALDPVKDYGRVHPNEYLVHGHIENGLAVRQQLRQDESATKL